MKNLLKFLSLLIFIPVTGCYAPVPESFDINNIKTYTDIPGITQEEIDAVEALKQQGGPLIYASSRTTELFERHDGTLGGYTVLLCEWLSELFGIQFQPEIQGLNAMLTNLQSGQIGFATLSDTPERRQHYFVTAPIAQRSVKMLRLEGSRSVDKIRQDRLPRYVFTQGTAMLNIAAEALESGSYETIIVPNEEDVYETLKDGRADAFIATSNMEAAFDRYGGIYAEDFLPLIFLPAAMVAEKPEFEAVISLVTKAIEHGAYEYMTELYRQGYQDYRRYKFYTLLNDEERAYIQNNPVIPFATQYMSYPISFYNKNEGKWDGVVFDIMEEIRHLTDLGFELVHDGEVEMPELLTLLENGTAYFMPNLIQSNERMKKFIWTERFYQLDSFTLISKQSYPNVDINDIPYKKVGFARGSAFADMFRMWFPNALYAIEYPNTNDTFMALDRGEVDLVLSSRSRLAALTNYYELSDYKANFIFNIASNASFGFNKDKTVLRSIIDKALSMINTDRIAEQWMSKTYNFEAIRLREDRIWLIGGIALSLTVLALVLVMFVNINKKRKTISKQAAELASLLEETKRYSALELMKHLLTIKAMNVALWDVDNTGAIALGKNPFDSDSHFWYSKEFRQMLGYADENDFPNKLSSWAGSIHPEDKERAMNDVLLHLKDFAGKTIYESEYRLKTKNGEYRYIRSVGDTFRDEKGLPLRMAGAIEDITEKKRMKETIDYHNRLLNTLSEADLMLLSQKFKNFDQAISRSLMPIAMAADIDQIVIYRTVDNSQIKRFGQALRWDKAEGGVTHIIEMLRVLPNLPVIAGWIETLSGGAVLDMNTETMSSDEKEFCDMFGVKSLFIAPVIIDRELWGAVSFQDHNKSRAFDENCAGFLRSAARLCANAVIRNEKTQNEARAIKSLEQREKMLKILNETAVVFLSHMYEEFDDMMNKGVRLIADALDLQGVSVFRNSETPDGLYGSQIYRWEKKFGGTTLPLDLLCNVSYNEFVPSWEPILSKGLPVNGPISNMPPTEAAMMKMFAVMSVYAAPVFINNKFWGFVNFEDCRNERYFDETSAELMRSAAFLCANTIIHAESNKAYREQSMQLAQRKIAEEEYKASSEAKSRFLAIMSHEIRTPMNVIMGSTESLLDTDSHSKETREILEKIYNSGDLLLRIINDILDLSKIEANKFEIVPQKYEVQNLINDAVNLNIIKHIQKDIEFKLHVDENLPLVLLGDELRIKQIINNMLSNAFKYTDSGEVSVSFFPENTTQESTMLVIRVKDTGQGMTDEQVNLLFSEYIRFNLEANRTTTGTGLGMAITKNLARLMNGEIKVESAPGKGSVFTAYIPQGLIDNRVLGKETADKLNNFGLINNQQKKKAKIIKEPMPYGKVLIVDDMKSNIDVAVLLLKPYQLQIDTAESGFEAIELIKSGKKYDLVFMDHMMPKMDGIETVKRIREWEREQLSIINYQLSINNEQSPIPDPQSLHPTPYTPLPIIALTANAIVGQAGMFMENGFDGCITKPIDTRELNAILIEYVRR